MSAWTAELERELRLWGAERQRQTTHGYWRWKLYGWHVDVPGEHALRAASAGVRGAAEREGAIWERWEGVKREVARQWPSRVPRLERAAGGERPQDVNGNVRPMTEAEVAERERVEHRMAQAADEAARAGVFVPTEEMPSDISEALAQARRDGTLVRGKYYVPNADDVAEPPQAAEEAKPMAETQERTLPCTQAGCERMFGTKHARGTHEARTHGKYSETPEAVALRKRHAATKTGVLRVRQKPEPKRAVKQPAAGVLAGAASGAGTVVEDVRKLYGEVIGLRRENAALHARIEKQRQAFEALVAALDVRDVR